jgi:DMSO reductase anchor subunit
MQPAFSVIFLTTLAGAAQGLFLALYGTELSGLALDPRRTAVFLVTGSLVALV